MSKALFGDLRRAIGVSQRELAAMLGVSEKAVESYEQGWRRVPGNIERMLHFLRARLDEGEPLPPCWELKACDPGKREGCVAWRSREGRYCWFLTGRLCSGAGPVSGREDDDHLSACRSCPVFTRIHTEERTCP